MNRPLPDIPIYQAVNVLNNQTTSLKKKIRRRTCFIVAGALFTLCAVIGVAVITVFFNASVQNHKDNVSTGKLYLHKTIIFVNIIKVYCKVILIIY